MTPIKVGDRVEVVRGFSVGAKGTVISVKHRDATQCWDCWVQRDQAGPSDNMGYTFSELKVIKAAPEASSEGLTSKDVAEMEFRQKFRKLGPYEAIPHPPELTTAECERIIDEEMMVRKFSKDNVNSPSHYTTGGIECFDAMQAMLTREEMIGYLRGNSFKYRWRFRHKGGAEDLKKAEWYEKKLLEIIENSA